MSGDAKPERPTPDAVPTTGSEPRRVSFAAYERQLAIAVLCSDVAHGLAPAMTYLREMLREAQMTDIDRSIGEEELVRLRGLMASLRRTKRRETLPRPVDVTGVIRGAVERVQAEGYGVAHATTPSAPVTIRAQEHALEVALVALLRNAFEAAPQGNVAVSARVEGDELWIEVRDDGPGLPDALLDGMFHPLVALAHDGRGTGLSLVLRVTRDHGWELSYARRDGYTVFTLDIRPRG